MSLPDPRLQRTPSASLSRQPLGRVLTFAALVLVWRTAGASGTPKEQPEIARYQELRGVIKQNLHFEPHCWCQAVTESTVPGIMKRLSLADVPVLLHLCRDKDGAVRAGTEETLVGFGESVRPALEEAMRSEDKGTVTTATHIIWLLKVQQDLRVVLDVRPMTWQKSGPFNRGVDLGDVRLETSVIGGLAGDPWISLRLEVTNHSASPVVLERAEITVGGVPYAAHPGDRAATWKPVPPGSKARVTAYWTLERPIVDLIGRGCELHLVVRVGSEVREIREMFG